MTRHDIEVCTHMEVMRKLCLTYRTQLSYIEEILIDESKQHITAEQAINDIRDYLVAHQFDLKLDYKR